MHRLYPFGKLNQAFFTTKEHRKMSRNNNKWRASAPLKAKNAYLYTKKPSFLRRVMFIQSRLLTFTTSSAPNNNLLALKGLSWSDINAPKYDWKSEAIACVLYAVLIISLLAFWLVLPELLAA